MSRATKAEMASRRGTLTELAFEHGPCSVRHLYYRSVVAELVEKAQSGYNKVQRSLLDLRREGAIPYGLITDNTRIRMVPSVWSGPEAILRSVARTYRRDLWDSTLCRVEVWVESDSIRGTIAAICDDWAVPMFVT